MNCEACESKVANLLQKLADLPDSEKHKGVDILCEIVAIQEKEMTELKKLAGTPKITVYEDGRKFAEAKELQLRFEGKNRIWFRAIILGNNKTVDYVDSMHLKGEV